MIQGLVKHPHLALLHSLLSIQFNAFTWTSSWVVPQKINLSLSPCFSQHSCPHEMILKLSPWCRKFQIVPQIETSERSVAQTLVFSYTFVALNWSNRTLNWSALSSELSLRRGRLVSSRPFSLAEAVFSRRGRIEHSTCFFPYDLSVCFCWCWYVKALRNPPGWRDQKNLPCWSRNCWWPNQTLPQSPIFPDRSQYSFACYVAPRLFTLLTHTICFLSRTIYIFSCKTFA